MNPPKNLRAFKVFAIEAGTVIDHIDAGNALKIISLLDLYKDNHIVTMGMNFKSKSQGYKDIIKVEHRELTPEEVNRVAIFAPHASINIIRNYEVVKKFKVEIPETIKQLIVCPNPMCITNHEKMDTIFGVKRNGHGLKFTCHYCEKQFRSEDIINYNT